MRVSQNNDKISPTCQRDSHSVSFQIHRSQFGSFQRNTGIALTSLRGRRGGTAGPSAASQQTGWVLGPLVQTSVCVTIASGWRLGLAGRRSRRGSAKKLTVKSCARTAGVLTHQTAPSFHLSIYLSILPPIHPSVCPWL